jgi:hypothetical protein
VGVLGVDGHDMDNQKNVEGEEMTDRTSGHKVTANIATMPSRLHILPKAIASLIDQVDEVRVYFNNFERTGLTSLPEFLRHPKINVAIFQKDLTDNGKLWWNDKVKVPELYICCDDDILYPPDFVSVIKVSMNKYPRHMIAFHGRRLWHGDEDRSYYHSHAIFHGLQGFEGDQHIDVPATFSTAFLTSEFTTECYKDPRMCMSDCLIALDAAKAGMPIIAIGHAGGWFGYLHPEPEDTIYHNHHKEDFEQRKIAAEIWRIKHGQK